MVVQWSGLPEELWKLILAKSSLHERMLCCIVSTKLHNAAVAATEQLDLAFVMPNQVPSVKLWNERHGHNLTTLKLRFGGANVTLTSLPCPRLQQLRLEHVCVQLGSSREGPGVLQVSTALTKLELHSCYTLDADNGLTALTSLPALQHLELDWVQKLGSHTSACLSPVILQHLSGLTTLAVGTSCRAADSLQRISCLTGLQSLQWNSTTASPILSPSTTPGLSCLTALTRISLAAMCFDPAVLMSCTHLQSLQLLDDDGIPGVVPGAASTLLSCVARMPCLQHLSICNNSWQWPHETALYGALTASSQLTELDLTGCELPSSAWGAVFPAGRSLPHLQVFSAPPFEPSGHWYEDEDGDEEPAPLPSPMQCAHVASLVSCCPALRECSIVVSFDAPVQPLVHLTGLTKLEVQGIGRIPFASLSALTSLEDLQVQLGAAVEVEAVLRLTALRHLDYLLIKSDAVSDWGGGDPRAMVCVRLVDHKVTLGLPVWLQLLQHCALNTDCQPVILRQLTEHVMAQQTVAEQQQQSIDSQRQINESQRRLNQHLQQQASTQDERVKQLQQQLAAASAQAGKAVELHGRLSALEGQVQQLLLALQDRA